MRWSTLFVASVFAAGAATAETSVSTEYHYFKSDGTEIKLANHSQPIKVGGVPIGITELPSNAVSGTAHHLSTGHHFGHRDWVINGSSWQYLEGYEDSRTVRTRVYASSLRVRSQVELSNEICEAIGNPICIGIDIDDDELVLDYGLEAYEEYVYESGFISSTIGRASPYESIDWLSAGNTEFVEMSLWATDDVLEGPIATIIDLADDIFNLLFDAFGFFAY